MKKSRSLRVAVLAVASLIGPGVAAMGQAAGLPSPTDVVMRKAGRTHEYLELLKSSNRAVQIGAMEEALKDPEASIRGLALEAYLRRFNTLTPEVVLLPGAKFTRADVPRLVIQAIAWAAAAPTMTGEHQRCYGGGVRGQIASGRLAVDYDNLCLARVLLGDPDDVGAQGSGAGVVPKRCEMILSPASLGDALEGPLHCEGVRTVLEVRLYFGA